MQTLKIETNKPQPIPGFALFALGFRPFFFVAGLSAVILLGVWLSAWSGHLVPGSYYGLIGWHSHEMLFGFATAVFSGFLLTAVRNWTGIDTLTGIPLALLVGLWLVGRLLAFAPQEFPPVVVALFDLAFLPCLLLALSKPLMQGKQKLNRIFLPLLGAMILANLLVHLEALGILFTADRGMALMLNLIILLVVIVGGRVIPFFVEKAVFGAKPKSNSNIEKALFAALLLLILIELLYPQPWLVGLLAAVVALTQIVRLRQWHDKGIWSIPILWVLFTGYGWLIFGFLLKSFAGTELVSPNLAVHALTVGGTGILTLGMMARVALGHTGRNIHSAPSITLAFVLLNIAALARVFGPIAAPDQYRVWIDLSGGLWIVAFLLFSVVYAPILMRARIDGRPG